MSRYGDRSEMDGRNLGPWTLGVPSNGILRIGGEQLSSDPYCLFLTV